MITFKNTNAAVCNGREVTFESFAQWCVDNNKLGSLEVSRDKLFDEYTRDLRIKADRYFS